MMRCRGEPFCIRQKQVCDGHYDCLKYGDDEALCTLKEKGCPDSCQCFGDTVSCINQNLTSTESAVFYNGGQNADADILLVNPKLLI